jgi:hypothetical protein
MNYQAAADFMYAWTMNNANLQRYMFIEDFVTGNGAGTKGENADITRELLLWMGSGVLEVTTLMRPRPVDVKPWATDKRLNAAGLKYPYSGTAMRHCSDAGRVLMFGACHYGLMKDPLR